jgi:hypothetical protein
MICMMAALMSVTMRASEATNSSRVCTVVDRRAASAAGSTPGCALTSR